MKEPITHFYEKFGFDGSLIKKVICGKKYLAVVLNSGKTGVCATLLNNVNFSLSELGPIDLTSISHRVFLTAYYNALFNSKALIHSRKDIFDQIDFSSFKNIVMIGYFDSLVKKFNNSDIKLKIFDLIDYEETVDIARINDYLAFADVVVLTSTSVFNNTFHGIIENTGINTKVMMLGPSTIIHPDMFKYKNVEILFGSVFHDNDEELLKIIASGKGTKSFMHRMTKVGVFGLDW